MTAILFFSISFLALFLSGFDFASFKGWKYPRMKCLISPIYRLHNWLSLKFSGTEIMPNVFKSNSMNDRLVVYIIEKTGAADYPPLEPYARFAFVINAIAMSVLGLIVLAKDLFV